MNFTSKLLPVWPQSQFAQCCSVSISLARNLNPSKNRGVEVKLGKSTETQTITLWKVARADLILFRSSPSVCAAQRAFSPHSFPTVRQDVVRLSDGQIGRCYNVLRQRRLKVVWQRSSARSTVTRRGHEWWRVLTSGDEWWLGPSLKPSHYKVDMTSVTPAIITGQDSWPLAVVTHVAVRRYAAAWLAAGAPRAKAVS